MIEAAKIAINKMASELLALNDQQSKLFIGSWRARALYRIDYPTEIAADKCMDGRVHLPKYTNTPLGIFYPFRNIGGKFDLGWPLFFDIVWAWYLYATSKGRRCIKLVTYHFARGSEGEDSEKVKHRGCKGHGYDTEAAKAASLALKQQYDRRFKNQGLYAIQCGVDTDLEALVLHGENGEVLDLATCDLRSEEEILTMLKSFYPQIPADVVKDLVPIVKGNIEHIAEVRASGKAPVDLEHKERVLAVGTGFDWFHEPNLALIIGPYDANLANVIAAAAGILQENIDQERVKADDGLVLLTSTAFRKVGDPEINTHDKMLTDIMHGHCEDKAQFLTRFALEVITEKQPKLLDNLAVITAICDMETRKLHLL